MSGNGDVSWLRGMLALAGNGGGEVSSGTTGDISSQRSVVRAHYRPP